ncbi:MAG: hypothetical protein A4S14_00585 [Proteobacteria bacterium SG_bin9]|nr:MAG: hypothetical protein A4S14_00585 [Proteobacteria bacterium SG_bin9]
MEPWFHPTARISKMGQLMIERDTQTIEYIGTMSFQLRTLAVGAGAPVLAHVLEMASLECVKIQSEQVGDLREVIQAA